MKAEKIKKMVIIAVFASISFALQMLVPFKVANFLDVEFSDLPALIISFAYGPISGVTVELLKNLLHCTSTSTGFVGEFANFVVNGIFVATAGLIYSYKKTFRTAIAALIYATISLAIAGVFVNLYIMLPLFKIPVEQRFKLTLGTILPFNIIKGVVTSVITLLIYKRISPIIKISGGKK